MRKSNLKEKILFYLLDNTGQDENQIAEALKVNVNKVSSALKQLEKSGMIRAVK